MPTCVRHGPSRSIGSSGTPNTVSTSAAPLVEEAARLPCLASFTPQAATTSDTAVEMLRLCMPSPPVPHTSNAPAARNG